MAQISEGIASGLGSSSLTSTFGLYVARFRDQTASEPQNSTDDPGGHGPACAREEAHAKPDADLMEVDVGRHVSFSLCEEAENLRHALCGPSRHEQEYGDRSRSVAAQATNEATKQEDYQGALANLLVCLRRRGCTWRRRY